MAPDAFRPRPLVAPDVHVRGMARSMPHRASRVDSSQVAEHFAVGLVIGLAGLASILASVGSIAVVVHRPDAVSSWVAVAIAVIAMAVMSRAIARS
jgi:hypothetical protein